MAAALFPAAAHMSAVCPFQRSCALTLAPRVSSARTAATLPVRAAVINAVSPSAMVVFGSAPAFSKPLDHRRAAIDAGQPERRHAIAIGGPRVRAGFDQKFGRGEIVEMSSPVQCRRAVGLCSIRIGTLGEQRADGLDLPVLHGLDDRGAPPAAMLSADMTSMRATA